MHRGWIVSADGHDALCEGAYSSGCANYYIATVEPRPVRLATWVHSVHDVSKALGVDSKGRDYSSRL